MGRFADPICRANLLIGRAMRNRLTAATGLLFEPGPPIASLDMARAQQIGGVFWLLGGLCAAIFLPFSPPTQQIGSVGWPLAGLGVATCFLIAYRRFDETRTPSLNEIFLAGCAGLAAIAALEWLAGGLASPYAQLYVLPAIYAAASHSSRRALGFLGVVMLTACLPLLYGPVSKALVIDLAAQLLMLAVLAFTARGLIVTVRRQRAELQDANKDAEALARRDPLTELGNRLAFQEAIVREVARARRSGRPLSLILGDLKNFKRVNDTLGHLGGDQCLKDAAEAIAKASRTSDECFRWGGDEFVVLLANADAEKAEQVGERIRRAVPDACKRVAGTELELTCAVTTMQEDQGPGELMAVADQMLIELCATSRDPVSSQHPQG